MIFSREEPTSNTMRANTNYVAVDEIYDESSSGFNPDNVRKLFEYITGQEGAGYQTVLNTLNSSTKFSNMINAEDMRAKPVGDKKEGQDILVDFGGLEWTVTALSKSTDGDPILTLMLSSPFQEAFKGRTEDEGSDYGFIDLSKYKDDPVLLYRDEKYEAEYNDVPGIKIESPGLFSAPVACDYDSEYWDSQGGIGCDSFGFRTLTADQNIAAMYGTSYLRAVTLNNGGNYVIYTGRDPSTQYRIESFTQSADSAFAKFTMNNVAGSVADYIVEPDKVPWQRYCDNEFFDNYDSGFAMSNATLYDIQPTENKKQFLYNLLKYVDTIDSLEGNGQSNVRQSGSEDLFEKLMNSDFDQEVYDWFCNDTEEYGPAWAGTFQYYGAIDLSDPENPKVNKRTDSGYSAWKNDKLWVPSLQEATQAGGIWGVSVGQNIKPGGILAVLEDPTIISLYSNESLRVCDVYGYRNSNEKFDTTSFYSEGLLYMPSTTTIASRSSYSQLGVASLIRPALHLNLKKAGEGLSSPPEKEKTWQDFAAKIFDNEAGNHLADTNLGIQNNPYKIATAEQLALLAKDVNNGNSFIGKYFIQTADIRLDGYEWTPIGTDYKNTFSGHFNGKGFKIDGLTINNTDDHLSLIGLFGYVSDGTIENLNLASGEVTSVDYYETNAPGSMGLIAYVGSNEQVIGCTNRANFNGVFRVVGGIAGCQYDESIIKDCTNYGKITTSSYDGLCTSPDVGAGGIVGSLSNGSSVENCFNYGNVKGAVAGGLVGQIYDGGLTIKNCISNATISGTFVGSLLGFALDNFIDGPILQNCAAFGVLEYVEFENWTCYPDTLGALIGVAISTHYEIEGCSFEGTTVGEKDFNGFCGYSSYAGDEIELVLTCCYIWINQQGCYSSESDNWSEYFTVLDMPKQKSLFWPAAAVDQTNEEIIAEMKAMGFTEYVQT